MNRFQRAALAIGLLCFLFATSARASDAIGFRTEGDPDDPAAFRTQGNGWTNTASGTSGLGAPAIVTWSIVPDGTSLPTGLNEPSSPSNLIAFLDGIHHAGASPGGADLTQRDWFELFEMSFNRWDELSGLDFRYESNDDGASVLTNPGMLETRGDHRIGGHSIDGPNTYLGYSYFPPYSDFVIDTDEDIRWGNSSGNYLQFRFLLTHEIGHGVGLNHLTSTDANFLMEPNLSTQFDGPQLDDILGVHRLYGDANEEDDGNENSTNATPLGVLQNGTPIAIGTDADDTTVDFTDVDFVSIDDNSDIDVFSFSIQSPSRVTVELTPKGPTYKEGTSVGTEQDYDSSAQSDLRLELLDTDGTTSLELSNDTGLGGNEDILGLELTTPGEYFVRIRGAQNTVQLYRLDLSAVAVPEPSTMLLLLAGVSVCSFRRSTRRKVRK